MRALLVWLVPPLAGALIGYVTNAVAIKMLFRPLKALHILGWRLPFTPGILPRQRHKLADNIGSMVSRELLTPEILKARLRRAEVRQEILRSLAGYTEGLLSSPLERFFPPPPPEENAEGSAGDGALRGSLAHLVLEFIRSPVFESILGRLCTALSEAYGRRTLRDILGASTALEEALERLLREGLTEAAPALLDLVEREAERAFPGAVAAFIRFLKQEEIHRELEVHGRFFLNKTLLRLNVFQRLFISAGQYDRTLHERMGEIVDDLIVQVEELLEKQDTKRRLHSFFRERGRSFLAGQTGVLALSRLILSYLDRPLEALVFQWTEAGFGELGRRLSSRIKAGELEAAIGSGVDAFLEDHRGMTLGELFSMDSEKKRALDALIAEKLLLVVDEQIEAILGSINIRTLVSDRIDALDMIKVERIVLDVMANQLTWINFFGALLGGLIGLFQSIFSRFIY